MQIGYESGSSATMTYITPWQYMPRFCQLILGDNYVDSDGANDRLYRTQPHTLPIYSSTDEVGAVDAFTNFYAVHIPQITGIPGPDPYYPVSGTKITRPTMGAVSGDDSIGVGLKYAYAKVSVQYAPLPYAVKKDEDVSRAQEWKRFVTVQRTPRVEFIQVLPGQLMWTTDPKSVVPLKTPTRDESIDYVVTWHRVPFVITDYSSFIGYANSADGFMQGHPQVPTAGFGKDQMLLVGVQETLVPQPWSLGNSTLLFNYSFFFQFKQNGHNAGLRLRNPGPTATLGYEPYSLTGDVPADGVAGNAKRAIKQVDMADLFLPR